MPATGVDEVRAVAERLRGANKELLGELGKSMRTVARPVVAEIRSTVRSSTSTSERAGSSAVERQLHTLARAGRKQRGKPLTERQIRSVNKRVVKLSSLRESIAAAAGSSVSVGPDRTNLNFRVRSGGMPPSQRKLPKRWNRSSGWKHPVFGNRNVWVKQTGEPYFDVTILKRADDVRASVVDAMDATARQIAHGGTE